MKKTSIIILGTFAYIAFAPYANALVLGRICAESTDVILPQQRPYNDCQCKDLGDHGVSKYINGSCSYSCDQGYDLTSSYSCVPAQPVSTDTIPSQPTSVGVITPPIATTIDQKINSLQAEVEALKNRIKIIESQKTTSVTQSSVSIPEVVKPIEKKVVPGSMVQPKAATTSVKTLESATTQKETHPIEVQSSTKKKSLISRFFSLFF